jgi:hypothetical protein
MLKTILESLFLLKKNFVKSYLFEVGGKNKGFEQIKDVENSYLAIDDTEIGHHNRIPLWTFGLLY